MTPTTLVEASTTLLAQLASPAARGFALAAAAGLGLAALRVRATNLRLVTWTTVLYAALAMPLLGWLLPSFPVPTPSFVQSALQSVRQNRIFGATAEQGYREQTSLPSAAERRNGAAHSLPPASRGGASRGTARNTDKPQQGKRPALAQRSTPVVTEANAPPLSLTINAPTTTAPNVVASSLPLPASIPWSTVAAVIYLTAAFFFLVRFVVGLAFSRRLLQASQIIDDPRVTARLASRAHASGMAFVPKAAESEFISVPVTMGALRSAILLPASWREWDDAKLHAVVAHEVSHVARRDALTQRLSLLHRAIFWFSPLAWWLDRHLANLAEQASDEAALSCGADRKHYANTLLEFFEALQAAPGRVWWQGVSMAKSGQAEERVERILSWKGTVTMGFKKSSFKKSAFKKSIAVAAVALAVPVVYLAASARPASYNGSPQNVSLAQNQTPPPAPRPAPAPQAQPDSAPAPAAAPTQEITPPPEPSAASDPAPAPPAIAGTVGGAIGGTITGTIRGGIASVPPRPGTAPVAPIAPRGNPPYAALSPVAPVAAAAPPAPAFAWSSQSSSGVGASHSSHGRGFSYAYGYDENQRFVIASGKTDSLTMSGSTEDAEHVQRLKKTIPGDFIWFERDEKSYIIRDQATIDRARKLWAPQEELGKKQEALGKQQEALGKQQEELGAKMEQVRVNIPDMTADLDKLKAKLKELSSSATMEQIGNIQSEIGDLQSKLGDLQSKAGDEQSKLGEQMGALGEQQGKLGDEQGKLGDQQAELARQATRQMKQLLDEAITKGTAQPEP
jgi:beta-lactamase regulating signal transducer with metallopeptidase domain